MTIELVVGAVVIVLAIIGGGAAWVRADQHGRTSEKLDRADGEVRDAEARAEVASQPPASRSEASAILRDRLARAARRLRAREGGRSE